MKRGLFAVVLMSWGLTALAGDSDFSAHLQAKFQVKACTVCHDFEDPRVLWGIEGALPNSGMLPEDKRQTDLVKGGLQEWEKQVNAWIEGGMKCK
ncbi:MAG: hypothetical protein ABIO78_00910 [Thermoanaerobaculia bacterium]